MSRHLAIVLLTCLFLRGSLHQVADAGNRIDEGTGLGFACSNSESALYDTDIVDYLDLHVITERDSYVANETIVINITISNASNDDIVLRTHPGIYDLLITDMAGSVAFRRPAPTNQVYCTVEAGLTTTMQYSVTTSLSPGTYTVTASLPAGSAASAEFAVIVPADGKHGK